MKNMLNRLKEKQNKKGFTLVEIIVVLVILAILASIAIPAVLGYVEDARKSQYIAEARSIYLVVQTEEAKLQAREGIGPYTEDDTEVTKAYVALYQDLINYDNNYQKKDGIIAEKTGIEEVYALQRESSSKGNDSDFLICWKSTDGKQITVIIRANKKVEIQSIS